MRVRTTLTTYAVLTMSLHIIEHAGSRNTDSSVVTMIIDGGGLTTGIIMLETLAGYEGMPVEEGRL